MHPWLGFWQKLILLAAGFVLTTACGALITSMVNRRAWSRQTRIELFAKRYDEGVRLDDELADLIGERFFAIQRLVWAMNDPDQYDLKKVRVTYFRIVRKWNACSRKYRSKIRVLVGEKQALAFLDYADDGRGEAPQSLHYWFVVAGRTAMAEAVEATRKQNLVDRLNHRCSGFIDGLTTVFIQRSNALALLEPIDPPQYPAGFEDRA